MSNTENKKDILVEKYFNGSLSKEESKELAAFIKTDVAFAESFALEKVIRSKKNLPSETARENFDAPNDPNSKSNFYLKLFGLLALLIGLTVGYLSSTKDKPQEPTNSTVPTDVDTINSTLEKKDTVEILIPEQKSTKDKRPLIASVDLEALNAFIVPIRKNRTTKSSSATIFYENEEFEKFISSYINKIPNLKGSTKRDGLISLGSANMMVGNFDLAIGYFQQLLDDKLAVRYHLDSKYNLAICLIKTGETKKGLAILQTIKGSRKSKEVAAILALVSYN